MFNQIGNVNGIGAPLPPNQMGGENFIRHIGDDKLIFDFKSGNGTIVKDRSRESNNGTFGAGAAAPTWKRNGLYFDGADTLTCSYSSSLTPERITVMAFAKTAGTGWDYIVSYDVYDLSYTFWFPNGDTPELRLTDTKATATTSCRDNNWRFLAGTYDLSHIKMYVDNALEIVQYNH